MPKPRMIMALAKVMIAAAWTDGSVAHEEINSLKDLLFHLPGMTARDWSELEIYLETPVGPDERARLVLELQEALSSRKDRELAISALEDLIQADGGVSAREGAVFKEIQSALEDINTGIFGQLGRVISAPVQRRSDAVAHAPNREIFLDDFIQNKIFYLLKQHLRSDDLKLDLPENILRKLSLAGGLMARVAFVDREITGGEFENIAAALQTHFGLEREPSGFVAEVSVSTVAKDLDYYRLSREFFEHTTEDERVHFLDVLFAVAAADGIVSHQEMEEIQSISNVLKLTHKQFIDAKLKIPRGQRTY
jgi:uncharacterized tellurite resistance protein B-like protein